MVSSAPVRGMRDFLPAEKDRRDQLLNAIRMTYLSHGYVEIETPVLERLPNLTSNQGGDNEKMLFKVQKRGLSGSDLTEAASPDDLCDLGLRYDLTLPLARYYAHNRGRIPEVFRCLQIGPVWRAERPQKGRYRQFTQCDIDVLGEPSPLAEVELMTTTVKALATLGLKDVTLRLNDRRLLTALLRYAGAPRAAWSRCLVVVDKLDKIALTGVARELADLVPPEVAERLVATLGEFARPGFDLDSFAGLVPEPEVPDLVGTLRRVRDAVRAGVGESAVSVRFDASLVRGMGYYSGPIFELTHPSSAGSLAGGGRYDGMVGSFAGRPVPACGFSIGFERILDLVTPPAADPRQMVAIVYSSGVDWGELVRSQGRLVEAGKKVRLVSRAKRLGPLLDALRAEGFDQWLEVSATGTAGEPRPLL